MLPPFTAFVSGKRKGREDRPPRLNAQDPERKISIGKLPDAVNRRPARWWRRSVLAQGVFRKPTARLFGGGLRGWRQDSVQAQVHCRRGVMIGPVICE